jgi:hypothetical protein
MNKKLITVTFMSMFFSSNILANNENIVFKKTDNSANTNLCYKLATANKKQVKNTVRASFNGLNKQRRALKGLKCNDMTAFNWTDKYGSDEVKEYMNKHNKNMRKGSVTITDLH